MSGLVRGSLSLGPARASRRYSLGRDAATMTRRLPRWPTFCFVALLSFEGADRGDECRGGSDSRMAGLMEVTEGSRFFYPTSNDVFLGLAWNCTSDEFCQECL